MTKCPCRGCDRYVSIWGEQYTPYNFAKTLYIINEFKYTCEARVDSRLTLRELVEIRLRENRL